LAHEQKLRKAAEEQVAALQRKLQSLQATCSEYKTSLDAANAQITSLSQTHAALDSTLKERF
jgi:peptidoglycan hydrolase CwlO-like protein